MDQVKALLDDLEASMRAYSSENTPGTPPFHPNCRSALDWIQDEVARVISLEWDRQLRKELGEEDQ